jgi:hypothetical protein
MEFSFVFTSLFLAPISQANRFPSMISFAVLNAALRITSSSTHRRTAFALCSQENKKYFMNPSMFGCL